jgi:hypothetical protein
MFITLRPKNTLEAINFVWRGKRGKVYKNNIENIPDQACTYLNGTTANTSARRNSKRASVFFLSDWSHALISLHVQHHRKQFRSAWLLKLALNAKLAETTAKKSDDEGRKKKAQTAHSAYSMSSTSGMNVYFCRSQSNRHSASYRTYNAALVY